MKRQISYAEEFQVSFVDTAPSRRWSIVPHYLNMVVSFHEVQHRKERKKVPLQQRYPTNTISARWSRSTSTVTGHADNVYLIWCRENGTLCLWSSFLSPHLCLITRKCQTNHKRKSTKYQPVLLKTVKVIKTSEVWELL